MRTRPDLAGDFALLDGELSPADLVRYAPIDIFVRFASSTAFGLSTL
jgi:hypothetical protein